MVEQANNFNGSIVDFYMATAQRLGTWMAMAGVRDRLKQNLRDETIYRRAVSYDFEVADWKRAHEFGKKFAKAYTNNDPKIGALLSRNSRPAYVSTNVLSKLITKTLEKRVKVSTRSDATEPVWFKCACCSTIRAYDESQETVNCQLVCDTCVENGYVRESYCMSGIILNDDAVQVYHSADDVESGENDWATADWCHQNGFYRRQNRYYSSEALEAVSEVNGIYGYHSGPDLAKIISEGWAKRKPMVLLGMELEVENVCEDGDENISNETIAKSIYKSIGKTVKNYMKCERDGSLDNGFEIITAPTGLDTHAAALAQLSKAEYFEEIHSHSTKTCGLHVHVCKAGMTVLHAAKLQQFINSPENEALVRTIARRYQTGGSGYARIERGNWIERMGYVAGPAIREAKQAKKNGWTNNASIRHAEYISSRFSEERYSALNFRNDHTVEFRLFRGTLKFESIMACLEFAYACWFFTREASVKELTTDNFMKFITRADNRKDTKHLRAYLKAKKFRAFYQAEQIARPKFKEQTPALADQTRMLDSEPAHIPLHVRAPAAARVAA